MKILAQFLNKTPKASMDSMMKFPTAAFSVFPTMARGYAFSPEGFADRSQDMTTKEASTNTAGGGDVVLRSLRDAMPLTPFGTMERFFDDEFFTAPQFDFPMLRDLDGHLDKASRVAPKYDIAETDDKFQLTMDLPGVRPEDCHVTLENGGKVLHLSGGRKIKEKNMVTESRFNQRFTLRNDLDIENINANLADGVMVITAPKKAPFVPEPRTIQVSEERPTFLTQDAKKLEDSKEEKEDDMFQLSLDVPGVRAEDCKVTLENEGRVLRVSGARKVVKNNEMTDRRFDQRFTIGKIVDAEHLSANLADGVMWITAPIKKEADMPSTHTVTISSDRATPLAVTEGKTDKMEVEDSKEA